MTNSTELAVRQDVAALTPDDLKKLYSIASALALSKRFPDSITADQAYAKVLLGHDLGLSPTQALTGLHIVEGKPQIAAVTLAGFVRKSERYDYAIMHHDDQACRIQFAEKRWASTDTGHGVEMVTLGVSGFTMEEAQRAGLVKERSNWVKWPKNMLFARAMSNGVKWFCPDLMGGIPVYTEADVFEGTAVDAGEGDGEPLGLDLGPEVEKVIARATELGHAGLADRASIEVQLGQQSPGVVAEWCKRANAELDAMDAEEIEIQIEVDGVPLNPVERSDDESRPPSDAELDEQAAEEAER